jgi:hypothetical protein
MLVTVDRAEAGLALDSGQAADFHGVSALDTGMLSIEPMRRST